MSATLGDLGLSNVATLTVLNKADGLTLPDGSEPTSEADLPAIAIANPAAPTDSGALLVSALHGWGIEALRARLAFEFFGEGEAALAFAVSARESATV